MCNCNVAAIVFLTSVVLVAQQRISSAYAGPLANATHSGADDDMLVLTPDSGGRALLTQTDAYVARNQKKCFATRSLVSCIKYKAAKVLWRVVTNAMGYFPNEYSRELRAEETRFRFIQLGEPSPLELFSNARSMEGDTEWTGMVKFVKRAFETFSRGHGLQLALSSESGARITSSEVEPRLKKKKKWLVLLPLVILWKIAHLKMTLVTLLLGVLGLNLVLVAGTAWLVHYLKFKTLCKIHPHLVQSHSHVYDSDPAEYSQFVGSSLPSSYYGHASSGAHEVGGHGYTSKDWGTSKAYSGYNYLDTISKHVR